MLRYKRGNQYLVVGILILHCALASCLAKRSTDISQPNNNIVDTHCEYHLFSNYKFSNNKKTPTYWKTVKSFVKGKLPRPCILHFSKTSFTVTEVVSSQFSSLILKTAENKILRLVKSYVQRDDLKDFYFIYRDLVDHGVPTVSTSIDDYSIDNIEYLLHEYLDIKFTFSEFVEQQNALPDKEFLQIYNSFIAFTKSLKSYLFIADLHGGNMVYLTNKKWIVMDFGASDKKKFVKYPGKKVVHFTPSHDVIERAIELRNQYPESESLLNAIKNSDNDLFSKLKINTLTDADPAIAKFLKIPDKWQSDIDDAIVLARVTSF
jgi:hypothetical protein